MNDYEIKILERIAASLERIANVVSRSHENLSLFGIDEEEMEDTAAGVNDIYLDVPITSDANPILRFLSNKRIEIRLPKPNNENGENDEDDENDKNNKNDEKEAILDKIAYFMGSKYEGIKKLYNIIKKTLPTGDTSFIYMRDETEEALAWSCQLCSLLYDVAFLEHYLYKRAPRCIIQARPSRAPIAMRFIAGQWFERFIRVEVQNEIHKLSPAPECAFLSNPQIILPNGRVFELDLMVSVGEQIFWFETKSGAYQEDMDKYSRLAKFLELDKEHAFVVLSEVSSDICDTLSSLFGVKVVNLKQFSEAFGRALAR